MKTLLLASSALTAATVMVMPSYAQDADVSAGTAVEDVIIVTGTAGGAEQRKVEAAFAVSTLDEVAIERFAPKSTADLLKAIPGVWSESSGGVAGANINLRGFPGTGDAPFVTLQLEGVPIYTPPSLSFLENSTLFRVDETIETVEAIRGGNAPVLSNGQPGLVANFRLKEGGEETEGLVRYTGSDYGLLRVDAVLSGEIADDLYLMVGGYVRSSEGVREAGFNAQEGYQLTLNLTKKFENGKFNVYGRRTDDSGTWYLPVPLNVPGVDASYTQVASSTRNVVVEGPFGEKLNADYGNGRGFDGFIAGGSFNYDFADGWTIVDKFSYLSGDADTLGLVPRGGARKIGDLGLASADTLITGRTLGADKFVQHYGFWQVLKAIDSFSNDLSITKTLDRGSITAGYFASRFGADDLWNLNNNARYLEVGGQREQVDIDCTALDPDLIPSGCVGGFRVNSRGDAQQDALYVAGSFDVTDNLTLDAGIRNVNHAIQYVAETGGDAVTGLTGVSNISTDYDESGTSWTAGANYQFNSNFGVFVRVNDGFRLPYFDDIRGGQTQLAAGDDLFFDVEQREVGLKYAAGNVSAYVTAFQVDTQAARSTGTSPGDPINVFETESMGLEFDGTFAMDNGFSVQASATFLDGEISSDPNSALVGNQAPRQPEFQTRIAPAYEIDMGEFKTTVFGAVSHVGDRQSNSQNTQPLGDYTKLDLGVEVASESGLVFRVFGDNITDEQGLTEGDPRSLDINANGRYILPASVRFSVGYEF